MANNPGGQRGRRIKKACMPTYLRGHTDAHALRCFLYQITLVFFYNSSEIWHFICFGSDCSVQLFSLISSSKLTEDREQMDTKRQMQPPSPP
uniref:Uncharacterized protein n=1 Tax=Pundamilia nyererei TaxID=303518 RepID=A0A3B4GAS9_9CICH